MYSAIWESAIWNSSNWETAIRNSANWDVTFQYRQTYKYGDLIFDSIYITISITISEHILTFSDKMQKLFLPFYVWRHVTGFVP